MRLSGIGFLSFQDSGIMMDSALGMPLPAMTRNSKTLSSVALSLIPDCIIGKISSVSGMASVWMRLSRACIHDLLDLIVFISPLWQSILNGWASFHAGIVLVLNLECTIATADSNRGSLRSR